MNASFVEIIIEYFNHLFRIRQTQFASTQGGVTPMRLRTIFDLRQEWILVILGVIVGGLLGFLAFINKYPAWIQAATALRCALLCVNGPHPFYFLACPSTHARTRACSHARVHNRTNAHTFNTHTNQSRRDGAVVPEWGGGVASRKHVAHVTVPCCYIGCFSPLPRSVGSHHLLAPPLIIHWFRV